MNSSRPMSYYNEIDPFAAQWLRNLIEAGAIARGIVDERSIEDVTPNDLQGFTQCHFFAGIGVWSHSLRLAGWPDNRPVWTGSCPCQPFSSAGKGAGFTDERHLWPAFFWLVSQCQPEQIFGEQVAASNANLWFDLVQADLESLGYAFGLVPFAAAGIGAPNARERAYWLANSSQKGLQGCEYSRDNCPTQRWEKQKRHSGARLLVSRMADANGEQHKISDSGSTKDLDSQRARGAKKTSGVRCSGGMANTTVSKQWRSCKAVKIGKRHPESGTIESGQLSCRSQRHFVSDMHQPALPESIQWKPSAVNGFWRSADWLRCRDARWRPVESRTFPLVNGITTALGHTQPDVVRMARRNRTGRLKCYGNALNAIAAAEFIHSFLDMEAESQKPAGGKQ